MAIGSALVVSEEPREILIAGSWLMLHRPGQQVGQQEMKLHKEPVGRAGCDHRRRTTAEESFP
ncbi:hypothetical protein OX90_12520 [Pseudomonas coronafaciens pv. porri]|uniref:Uncharacterized protein n=1 Tax=Pseudomonas coronafaciens pv. porri TaxID=83964 RepID=A0ABR5JQ12_9PSED|nr:hypothetical protein OX88_08040 [Pseudomonas coronafaciens pv. porri]KOP59235.1 hypothetical protein OX90_12520 [Pseudomonas coronafaciens pv. porri]